MTPQQLFNRASVTVPLPTQSTTEIVPPVPQVPLVHQVPMITPELSTEPAQPLIVTLHSGRTVYLPPAPPLPRPFKLTSQCSSLRAVFKHSMFDGWKVPERVDHVHRHNVQSYTMPEYRVQVPCYNEAEGRHNEPYITDLMYPSTTEEDESPTTSEPVHDPIFLPLSTIPSPLLYHSVPYGPDYSPATSSSNPAIGRVIFKDSTMPPPRVPICDSRGVARNSMTDKAALVLHGEVLIDSASITIPSSDRTTPASIGHELCVNEPGVVREVVENMVEAVLELEQREEMLDIDDVINDGYKDLELLTNLTNGDNEYNEHIADNELDDFEEAMSEIEQDCQDLSLEHSKEESLGQDLEQVVDLGQEDRGMDSDHNKENELQLVNTDVNSLKCLIQGEDKRSYPNRERKSRTFFI